MCWLAIRCWTQHSVCGRPHTTLWRTFAFFVTKNYCCAISNLYNLIAHACTLLKTAVNKTIIMLYEWIKKFQWLTTSWDVHFNFGQKSSYNLVSTCFCGHKGLLLCPQNILSCEWWLKHSQWRLRLRKILVHIWLKSVRYVQVLSLYR
jgi:hypothetical protein